MGNSNLSWFFLDFLKTVVAEHREVLITQCLLNHLRSLFAPVFHYKFLVGIIKLLEISKMFGEIMRGNIGFISSAAILINLLLQQLALALLKGRVSSDSPNASFSIKDLTQVEVVNWQQLTKCVLILSYFFLFS